jgi:hypothetical protein
MNSSPKTNDAKPRRKGDKVATYIARGIGCCIGIALLIIFVASKIWQTTDYKVWTTFGAIIGLCLGYGLGGDIWGARLFDFFTNRKTRFLVGQDDKPAARFASKTIFFALVGILVFFLALFIRVLIYNRHTTP